MKTSKQADELIGTIQVIKADGKLVLQVEEEPSQFREKLWRMQWEQGKDSFERYRQLRRKMVRQYKEIQSLKAQLAELSNDDEEANGI